LSKKLAEHNPGRKIFSSKIATTIVWLITIIWTVPTVGLLVTSFKTDEKILNEAWWDSLLNPDFTFANYKGVFLGDGTESLSAGVLPYFINSSNNFSDCDCNNGRVRTCLDSLPR
jgi:alpha-glucoside transport system permease protein